MRFTPKEAIDSMKLGDVTSEMLGIVILTKTNLPGALKMYKKIVLDNGEGQKVQLVAWEGLAKKLEKIDKVGMIVHVTALKATTIKDQKYNLGNVEFELSLTSGSKIRLYGHHNSKEVEQMKATAINLKDICKFVDKKISTNVFVKLPIDLFTGPKASYYIGAITDGSVKVEICTTLTNFDQIDKGEFVNVEGTVVQFLSNVPYIQFHSKDHYKKIPIINEESKLSMEEIVKVFKYPSP